ATMMNVLYAGIDNPISISVPGVPNGNVSASMTNGSLVRNGDSWIARPGKVGEDAVVTVSASMNGGASRPVSSMTFRVRSLPDPTAYINLGGGGGNSRYKGGRPISKAAITSAKGLGAAIDDGVLDIDFKVTGFETVVIDGMGNNMIEQSAGSQFSSRQIEAIKRLNRGKRFYISRIKAVGPDGSERILSPVEVIIN
ncbi:MAG: gliding motility protein GldM, partial [Paramuribaculum sp.]|nr:gliding motility protein GldM [Paramuribaculum sp.]